MKYRFFSVPAVMPDEAQEAVNRFCAAHRIVSAEKQFASNGEQSFWALCVSYLDQDTGPIATRKIDILPGVKAEDSGINHPRRPKPGSQDVPHEKMPLLGKY